MKNKHKHVTHKRSRLVYIIPFIWFFAGWMYSLSLDTFADIGMMILTIITTIALFIGIFTWRVTHKWYMGIIAIILALAGLYFLLIGSI